MIRALCSLVLIAAAGVLVAFGQPEAPAETSIEAQVRFGWVDIVLDSREASLAAWQVELTASEGVTVVGIEGGDHAAFAEPPHYDPKALMGSERVILGAFDTGDDLPSGATRVARVHLRIGVSEPTYELTVTTAATADGTKIDAAASVIEGSAE